MLQTLELLWVIMLTILSSFPFMSFTTNRPVWITLPTLLISGGYMPGGVKARAVLQDTFQCSGTTVRHDNSAMLFALHFLCGPRVNPVAPYMRGAVAPTDMHSTAAPLCH